MNRLNGNTHIHLDKCQRASHPISFAIQHFENANETAHSYTLNLVNVNPVPHVTAFQIDNALRAERLELVEQQQAAVGGGSARWVLRRSRVVI